MKGKQESCSRYNHDNGERAGCPETPKDIAIMKPDITENGLLGKEAPDDTRPCKQQDIDKEDANDWTNKGIIESKATDQESDDDDEYWDTLTDIDENEVTQIDDSDEETFWESPTEPEDIAETKVPVTCNNDKENELESVAM